MSFHLKLGRRGEHRAAHFLKRECRHRILAKNYSCPVGEIDLVTLDGDTIVFVEVRTRSSDELQAPFESVRSEKRRRVERAARHFLTEHDLQRRPCRFDIVSIVWPARGKAQIEHFPDAFHAARA